MRKKYIATLKENWINQIDFTQEQINKFRNGVEIWAYDVIDAKFLFSVMYGYSYFMNFLEVEHRMAFDIY